MKSLGPIISTPDAAYEAIQLATAYISDHFPNGEAGGPTEI
jgi:hypothetical protein